MSTPREISYPTYLELETLLGLQRPQSTPEHPDELRIDLDPTPGVAWDDVRRVALMARDRGGPALGLQVLVYPVIDFRFDTPSHLDPGDARVLQSDEVRYYWYEYLSEEADGAHPYASPRRKCASAISGSFTRALSYASMARSKSAFR